MPAILTGLVALGGCGIGGLCVVGARFRVETLSKLIRNDMERKPPAALISDQSASTRSAAVENPSPG